MDRLEATIDGIEGPLPHVLDDVWNKVTATALTLCHKIYVFVVEAFTVITQTLPNAIKWCWRVQLSGAIVYAPLSIIFKGVNKTASLFLHNSASTAHNGVAIIFLHGDYSHPYTMLHFADRTLNEEIGHVYSIHLHYDDAHPEIHQTQLKQAIDKIEQAVRDSDGCFKGVIAVGHSRGSLEAAICAFGPEYDARVQAVTSIAGRFKVTSDRAPRESLRPTVEIIEKALAHAENINLYQIAAGQDWCIPPEAALTLTDPTHTLLIEDAMHLNVIYHLAALTQVSAWLKQCSDVIAGNVLPQDQSRSVPLELFLQTA